MDAAGLPDARDEGGAVEPGDVALVHTTDAGPGISRRRRGRGFSYHHAGGGAVRDAAVLSRIAALAIPPAWTDVWISAEADGHLQATGRDARGRKQYLYHARWAACRDEVKYSGLVDFARALPGLRGQVDADLRRRGTPREKVLASIVWLLDNAMIRIGNAAYAQANGSFGLTTLRSRHVAVNGATLRFAFRGKSGKKWRLAITDRRIARVVRQIQELPGQSLFQYLDGEGDARGVTSQDVNLYIREAGGNGFSSKHFRTWGGTVRAAGLLSGVERPPSKRETARVLNAAIDAVADKLGNTRSVCRSCYIHPRVIEAWTDGRLGEEMAAVRRRYRRVADGLDPQEAHVLHWLEKAS